MKPLLCKASVLAFALAFTTRKIVPVQAGTTNDISSRSLYSNNLPKHEGTPKKPGQYSTSKTKKQVQLEDYYQHEDREITHLGFALALLVIVLPPAIFVCIYAPGECLMAVGMAKTMIGTILAYVHSQDPTRYEYPAFTSGYIYIWLGICWVLGGLGKRQFQRMKQDMEEEDAKERRKKYSERRALWEQEASRDRRYRKREQRRRKKTTFRRQNPAMEVEMAPLMRTMSDQVNRLPAVGGQGEESDNDRSTSSLNVIV